MASSSTASGQIDHSVFWKLPEGLQDENELTPWHPRAVHAITQHSIQQQLQDREDEYTDFHRVRIFTGTWNVNGKWPNEEIESWLCPPESQGQLADIYAIGLQEMVDLSAANVVLETQSIKRASQWRDHIKDILDALVYKHSEKPNEAGRFEVIGCHHLVGILILVLARQSFKPHITETLERNAGVGIMGVMGNKGGTSIRFKLHDSTFCFVSSHLAARRSNVSARNSDFAAIVNKTQFQDADIATALQDSNATGEPFSGAQDMGARGIFDHDIVFWLGDLNYRIHESLTIAEVRELAKRTQRGDSRAYETLRAKDQLNIERAKKRTFHGFEESTLTFPPTYKYEIGTSKYEERPDKKERAPAWCDRVLWRTGVGYRNHIRQICYNSSAQTASDHKPVYSLFDVDVRITNQEEKRRVHEDILQQVDIHENASRPQVSLSAADIDMGNIVVGLPKAVTIALSNVGNSVARWFFVPKLEDQWFAAPWLSVQPAYGLLQPEQSQVITIAIHYSLAVSRDVSLGKTSRLDELLVLRIKHGRDYFLTVSAKPVPSSFGCSIEQLCRRREPIRELELSTLVASQTKRELSEKAYIPTQQDEEDLLGLETIEQPKHDKMKKDVDKRHFGRKAATPTTMLPVPKELWWLMDALLQRRGLSQPDIFVSPGDPQELAQIRECIDHGMEIPEFLSAVSIAASILQFLVSLRDPLIPVSLFPGPDLTEDHIPKYCTHVLSRIDSMRFNTLLYVISLVKESLTEKYTEHNGLNERAMLFAVSRACMRKSPHDDARVHHSYIAQLASGGNNIQQMRKLSEGSMQEQSDDKDRVIQQLSRCYGAVNVADPGTGWEPTAHEQSMMIQIFKHLLSMDTLG